MAVPRGRVLISGLLILAGGVLVPFTMRLAAGIAVADAGTRYNLAYYSLIIGLAAAVLLACR